MSSQPHRVVIVALPHVVAADLATVHELFSRVRLADGAPGYAIRVCGPAPVIDVGAFALQLRHDLSAIEDADTVVFPGVDNLRAPLPSALSDVMTRAMDRGARVISVCTGAFTLAELGLLHGRRATTHWLAAEALARRFPTVEVDPDVLYVDEGQVLTSAGAAAAFDLCLHIVRRDYGVDVASAIARASVMPLERDGGQSQFITQPPPAADGGSLEPTLRWLADHLDAPLTLDDIAKRAGLSVRSLNRRFKAQTGTTPLQWLLRARVRRAQGLLEMTDLAVEQIGEVVGFGSPAAFRDRFRRVVHTSPVAYRRAFRSRHAVKAMAEPLTEMACPNTNEITSSPTPKYRH